MRIPLVRPTIEADDVEVMIKACQENRIEQGEVAHKFEREFSNFIGAKGGVVTNSGTSALHLALCALDIGEGDEVITPTYTCVALLNAIKYVGATSILVDNNFDVSNMDFNLSISAVDKKITDKTKAIIVPPMFGVPVEMKELLGFGIPTIEDGTLSIGAMRDAKTVGSSGLISVFSFHASKMLACGEGGMILAKSEELLDKIRYLNGWEGEQAHIRLEDCRDIGYTERFNYRMSDISASLGLNQLKKINEFIDKRIEIAKRYNEIFRMIKTLQLPKVKDDYSNVFFRYMVKLNNLSVKEILTEFLKEGIEVGRGVYPPLHYYLKEESSAVSRRRPSSYPNAEKAINSLISIPIYPSLTEAEIQHIIDTTISILGSE